MSYNGRVPVWGFVSSTRKSTRDDRLNIQKKRQDEADQMKKERERQAEAAKILAQRWAEEDRKKTPGGETDAPRRRRIENAFQKDEGNDSDRQRRRRLDEDRNEQGERPVRRIRDDDEGGQGERRSRCVREEQDVSRRAEDEGEDPIKDSIPDSTSTVLPLEKPVSFNLRLAPKSTENPLADEEEEQDPSGWQTTVDEPQEQGGDASTGKRTAVQTAFKEANSASQQKRLKRLKGVFGMSDSEDEKETARVDFKLAIARKGKDRAYAVAPPKSAAPQRPTSTVAEVQMKVAKWKADLNGKAAKMPEDLQREVAAVMGVQKVM